MKILESIPAWIEYRATLPSVSIGFVPTMGALHSGHESLIQRSVRENDFTVLSIFVNPTQFNDPKDFEGYPKTWEQDLEIAKKYGVDAIFSPRNPDEMYPDQYHYQLSENDFSLELCGEYRPGHFEGMLTVVLKLFNLVVPTRAYFGEKDYQQFQLVSGMVKALFLPVQVMACPTVREADGLALSSRNLRLTPEERKIAPALYQVLTHEESLEQAKKKLEALGFRVEYLVEKDFPQGGKRRLVAAHLGKVRLIDNVGRSHTHG